MPDASGLPTSEEREAYLQEALPVQAACLQGVLTSTGPKIAAHVWIDPSMARRLEVLAPGRLLRAAEGFKFAWVYENEEGPDARFLLDVQSGPPVRVAFHLLFPLPRMITVLEGIAQFGMVSIMHCPLPAGTGQPGKQGADGDLLEAIEEHSGQALVLILPPHVMCDLGEHVELWKARHPHLLPAGQRTGGAGGFLPAGAGDP